MKGSLQKVAVRPAIWQSVEQDIVYSRRNMPKGRVSRIDTDIEHSRRPDVIKYLKDKYGAEKVSQIITFGTLAAKMAIRDVGKVMGYSVGYCTALAKLVPSEPKMTIDKALKENPEFSHRYETEDNVRKIVDMAKKLEGNKRHASQHACGLVIGPSKISDFLPTAMIKNDETGEVGITTQVIMTEVEELSLLKMDLLGLKNLSVIHDCMDGIKKKTGKDMDYHDIPLDDRHVFEFLRDGHTGGVFQLESPGMTKVVQKMLVDVDDLPDSEMKQGKERMTATVALYRPGPMDFIPDYIDNMKDHSMIHYDCPQEESVLESTYGIIVYQGATCS